MKDHGDSSARVLEISPFALTKLVPSIQPTPTVTYEAFLSVLY